MSKFNSKDFKTLFERVYLFDNITTGFKTREEEGTITDNFSGKDITHLMDLPIFPQLSKINMGENVDLADYVEIEDDKKVVGARGVLLTGMDWDGPETGTFFYEFGHVVKDKKPIDYIKDFHMDSALIYVLEKLDKESGKEIKGSELGHMIMSKGIENIETHKYGISDEIKNQLKYVCLIEAEHFDVWKVGIPRKGYQLILTGENMISVANHDFIIQNYLRDVKITGNPVGNKYNTDTKNPRLHLENDNLVWFYKGTEKIADTKDDIIYNGLSQLSKQTNKLDSHILQFAFEALENEKDLTKEKIPLLVKGLNADMKIPGTLGKMDNIYSVITTYDKLADLVKNPRILRIEAGKPVHE